MELRRPRTADIQDPLTSLAQDLLNHITDSRNERQLGNIPLAHRSLSTAVQGRPKITQGCKRHFSTIHKFKVLELMHYGSSRKRKSPWTTLSPQLPENLLPPAPNTRSRHVELSDTTELANLIQILRGQLYRADENAARITASHVYNYSKRMKISLKDLMEMLDTPIARSMILSYAPCDDAISYCNNVADNDHECYYETMLAGDGTFEGSSAKCVFRARCNALTPEFANILKNIASTNELNLESKTDSRFRINTLFEYWDCPLTEDTAIMNVHNLGLKHYLEEDTPEQIWLKQLCSRLYDNTMENVICTYYFKNAGSRFSKTIDIDDNNAGYREGTIETLLTYECIDAISRLKTKRLSLIFNAIPSTFVTNFAKNASLVNLNFRYNCLGDKGVGLLLSSVFEKLQALDIGANQLTDKSIGLIRDALIDQKLPAIVNIGLGNSMLEVPKSMVTFHKNVFSIEFLESALNTMVSKHPTRLYFETSEVGLPRYIERRYNMPNDQANEDNLIFSASCTIQ